MDEQRKTIEARSAEEIFNSSAYRGENFSVQAVYTGEIALQLNTGVFSIVARSPEDLKRMACNLLLILAAEEGPGIVDELKKLADEMMANFAFGTAANILEGAGKFASKDHPSAGDFLLSRLLHARGGSENAAQD